jgi:hypothetical protein
MNRDDTLPLGGLARGAEEDLRLALGCGELAKLVRDVIPAHAPRGAVSESAERLLALLTFSYASGVYDSTEIPHEFGDEDLAQLPGTQVPLDQHALRRFRRNNRSELRDCLSHVLRRARSSSTSSYPDCSLGRWTMGNQEQCEAEAEERINRAVRADTFALDD